MKISVTWRLLMVIAGMLVALMAGWGAAAPAAAMEITANGSSLSLSVAGNGSYSVRGSGYTGSPIHVWVVNIRKDRAVDQRSIKPRHGSFSFSGGGLECNAAYKAVSFSKLDGWNESRPVSRKC
ncbi:hypothetical protein ACFQ36_04660 [Arthrobacter sp. GCM10027362]|uniref:hypothetical protein n=1 Tax=Arthrobacter sp. GCM10027362 TaxID=3273379 RepID=UPI0036284802